MALIGISTLSGGNAGIAAELGSGLTFLVRIRRLGALGMHRALNVLSESDRRLIHMTATTTPRACRMRLTIVA